MSYDRVIPRDLFNEAKLLKCLGRVVINAETSEGRVDVKNDGAAFNIQMSADALLYVENVQVIVNGSTMFVGTIYNSRSDWPLVTEDLVDVLDDAGNFTEEFLALGEGSSASDVDESLPAATRVVRTPTMSNRIRAQVDRMFENDRGWKARVRQVYASLEELERYDEMYGIVERAGFETAQELWDANPLIGGSVEPSDFGVRKESRLREAANPETAYRRLLQRIVRRGTGENGPADVSALESQVRDLGKSAPNVVGAVIDSQLERGARAQVDWHNIPGEQGNAGMARSNDISGNVDRVLALFGIKTDYSPGLYPTFHVDGYEEHNATSAIRTAVRRQASGDRDRQSPPKEPQIDDIPQPPGAGSPDAGDLGATPQT